MEKNRWPSMSVLTKMGPQERKQYLNSRLQELLQFSYEKSPALKDRLDRAGIKPSAVKKIEDLQSMPILRKDDLIELCKKNPPFAGLVTLPTRKIQRIYISPGPIFDPHHDSKTYWRRHAQLMKDLGFRKHDVVINAWSYHLVPAGLLVDESLRRIGVTVIPMGTGNTELHAQVIKNLRVTGFFGATGFFMNIITKAEEMGFNIRKDFNLRLACIGGEMGGGPMRKLVEEKYGIATSDVYGTADVGLMAFECSEKSGLHIAEDVIVEIIDPATGKPVSEEGTGELVITPIDDTYPLLRFGTGDLVGWVKKPCSCGRTSLKITRILGRIGDAVRTRGMFIHPRQLEPVMAGFPDVLRYQAVVTRTGFRDELLLQVELKDKTSLDKESLSGELIKQVSDAIRIKVDKLEFVEKGKIPENHKTIVDKRVY